MSDELSDGSTSIVPTDAKPVKSDVWRQESARKAAISRFRNDRDLCRKCGQLKTKCDGSSCVEDLSQKDPFRLFEVVSAQPAKLATVETKPTIDVVTDRQESITIVQKIENIPNQNEIKKEFVPLGFDINHLNRPIERDYIIISISSDKKVPVDFLANLSRCYLHRGIMIVILGDINLIYPLSHRAIIRRIPNLSHITTTQSELVENYIQYSKAYICFENDLNLKFCNENKIKIALITNSIQNFNRTNSTLFSLQW